MAEREREILLFDAFCKALRKLCAEDRDLFATQKRKAPITHRLAMYLEAQLSLSGLVCDTQFQIKDGSRCFTPDIVAHNRKGDEALALYWEDGYLSAKEKEEARDFHSQRGCFTLAFSLLPEKDYFLIYRFAESYTDYLHVSKEDFSEELLKRCRADEDIFVDQLQLKLVKKRSRTSSAAQDTPTAE